MDIVLLVAVALVATACLTAGVGAVLAAGRLLVVDFPAACVVAFLAVGRGAALVAAGLAAGFAAALAAGLAAFTGVFAAVLAFAGVAFTAGDSSLNSSALGRCRQICHMPTRTPTFGRGPA
ncbi:MAG: hypothetical protein KDH18_15965, partial [Rhodoferax sp.]|nr:hypothetical protein [Rhodoferax sp.]